ncbi:MAG: hypothetical protein AAF726_13275 [Planctomycetota bacterium]
MRPHMPGWRTTIDGRIGIQVEHPWTDCEDPQPRIGLMIAEDLQQPLLTNEVTSANQGTPTMYDAVLQNCYDSAGTSFVDWDGDALWKTTHACLWDDGDITAVDGQDVYQIKVVVTSRRSASCEGGADLDGIRVTTTPIEVVVANPKTPAAHLVNIQQTGAQTMSSVWEGPVAGGGTQPFGGFGFEPAIAYDGRLLVLRISSSNCTWYHPETGLPQTTPERIDIVYAWSEFENDPANAANWNEVYPITLAPYDSRINGSDPTEEAVGFALEPFRDSKGNPILDLGASEFAHDIGGSYPWIDRKGDNLWMETIREQLARHDDPGAYHLLHLNGLGKYPYRAQMATLEPEGPGEPLDVLRLAAEGDQDAVVLHYLDRGVDPAASDAMVPALGRDDVELATLLLDRGFPLERAISAASCPRSDEAWCLLLDRGYAFDKPPIGAAQYPGASTKLVGSGAYGKDHTVLISVVRAGRIDLVDRVIDEVPGLDGNEQQLYSRGVRIALQDGQLACLERLLERGGKLEPRPKFRTALELVLVSGDVPKITYVLNAGYDVTDRNAGRKALQTAILADAPPEVVALLLDRGAQYQERYHASIIARMPTHGEAVAALIAERGL